jgi:hypothetical protein
MTTESEHRAPLSPHYAFVVQWATDTQIAEGRIHGRVEHVVSRHATHFASLDELLAFMARMLREVAAPEHGAQAEAERLAAPDNTSKRKAVG